MTIKDVHLNNGKVLIGSAYYLNPLKPKYIEEDTDMLNLQSYLIYDPARLKREYWMNKCLLGFSLFVLTLVLLKGCSA
jgi:hypothetical protein